MAPDKREKRLAQRFSEAIRERHYSRRTEKAYWHWIRYFIFFHGKRHPAEMGARRPLMVGRCTGRVCGRSSACRSE
jgi:hypothetical protein